MTAPFRLSAGASAPRQQTRTSCGAACVVVARMLVDPPFARWVTRGEGSPVLGAEGATESERFASYEAVVHGRTNGRLVLLGRPSLPWPRRLGTPPWGVAHELEREGSTPGTRYRIDLLRHRDEDGLRAAFRRLRELVVDGEPAVLYVGNDRLPRHATLVLPGGNGGLDVYDPHPGRVRRLDEDAFATGALGLAGWDVAWFCVQPTGHRRVRDLLAEGERLRLPHLAPDPMPDAMQRESARG